MNSLNPARFLLENPDVPFNFGMSSSDWDALYHNSSVPSVLKSTIDPCQMSAEEREAIDKRARVQMARYTAWCRTQENGGELA